MRESPDVIPLDLAPEEEADIRRYLHELRATGVIRSTRPVLTNDDGEE